ncbi:MAG: hypothetical protein Q7K45_07650 [Nanoarchaeota archaeon]|nr:hypothetical protein [Nanoarchaeota archaeon]
MTFISKVALSVGLLYGVNIGYHASQILYLDDKVADSQKKMNETWNEMWYTGVHGSQLQMMANLDDIVLKSLRQQRTLHEKRTINPLYGVEVADLDFFK